MIQVTPPGSGCSTQFGTKLTPVKPGSAQGLLLIVSDIQAAGEELVARGIETSEVFHCSQGTACRFQGKDNGRVSGPILSAVVADLSDEFMYAAFVNIPSDASAVVGNRE